MPIPLAIPLAITGISALAQMFGNRKKTSQQTQQTNQQSTSTQNFNVSDLPAFGAEQQTGIGVGLNSLINRVAGGTDLEGYKATGRRALAASSRGREAMVSRLMAQRGLGSSPASAAILARGADEDFGKYLDFENSLPQLKRQQESEDAMNLIRAVSSVPTGTNRTGQTTTNTNTTGNTTGTVTQPGDMLGGLFSGLGQGIAGTFGYNSALDELSRRFNLGGGARPAGGTLGP